MPALVRGWLLWETTVLRHGYIRTTKAGRAALEDPAEAGANLPRGSAKLADHYDKSLGAALGSLATMTPPSSQEVAVPLANGLLVLESGAALEDLQPKTTTQGT